MTITLDLAPDTKECLRRRAEQEGQAAKIVARELLVQAIRDDVQSHQGTLSQGYGINPKQAAEIRVSFASFAKEWNQPEIDVYDDYDAAKARLEPNPVYKEVQT